MKKIILVTLLFSLNVSFASDVDALSSVEVIKQKDEIEYKNIPHIIKTFKGAKNSQERVELEKECQEWVLTESKALKKEIFKVWCTRVTDVVLREYQYKANILIRNW